MTFEAEKQVAIAAVRRACFLTSSIFQHLRRNETVIKDDESPVTAGDFSAQAVINTILSRTFPQDPIVGEEDSSELRPASAEALRSRIVELANEALISPVQEGENAEWGLGPGHALSPAEVLNIIDRGTYQGGKEGRMWTLDPIDGTKGFLRGGQYAVCLALIVDSEVKLGVVGCPNLLVSPTNPDGPRGCIFYAVRGEGTYQVPLSDYINTRPIRLDIPARTPENLRIWQSVGHTRLSLNDQVAHSLGLTASSVSMDSQAKYCSILREGGIYLRLPEDSEYREKIWDHAPSSILIEEAGGIVSDAEGRPLDFGLGRALAANYGTVAAGSDVHSSVLTALKEVKEQ